MKRIVSLLLCAAIMLLPLTGCSVFGEKDAEQSAVIDHTHDIFDASGSAIGQIELSGHIMVLNNRLVYSLEVGSASESNKSSSGNNPSYDFYCRDMQTDEEEYLGTIEDVYGSLPHQELYYNGHIYSLIALGEVDKGRGEFAVFDIDLAEKKIKQIHSTKEGCIYDMLSIVNGKLLISHLSNEGTSALVEYDIGSNKSKTVLTENAKEGIAIRAMYGDSDNVFIIRVERSEVPGESKLFLDTYDLDYNKLSSTELHGMFNAESQLLFDQTDQMILNFKIQNGYIWYENNSTARFLGKMEKDGSLDPIITDGFHALDGAFEPCSDDEIIMFSRPGFGEKEDKIYMFNTSDGTLKMCSLGISEDPYYLSAVFKGTDDHILISMSARSIEQMKGTHSKLFYMSLSDLEFEDVANIEAEFIEKNV